MSNSTVPARSRRALSHALLRWYDTHRRDLPWRRTSDPYAVWVSEMMLQQTQVQTVVGYYERWLARFPTVRALAEADEQSVLHAWQGLGYYSRARNLHRAALLIVRDHGGVLPRSADCLRRLPGIGPYSAGAIASIAYGEREPVVDGNVVRVLCRRFGIRGDPAHAAVQHLLWSIARELVPEKRCGDFNQALMELGATVCTPREPECARCPLQRECVALRESTVSELPQKTPRRATVRMNRAALVLRAGERVLVAQFADDAPRWRGMWEFPSTDVASGESTVGAAQRLYRKLGGERDVTFAPLCVVRHSVTHHRIALTAFSGRTRANTVKPALNTQWLLPQELDDVAMPSAQRKIAKRVQQKE